MNARQRLAIMIRTDRGSMTVWSQSEVRDALDAFHAEVVAERDAMTVAWLVKKAREFRAMGGRERAAQADAVAAMASKLERGAVRPDNLRTLPADFFEPGHTYAFGEYRFRCETHATHPVDGHLAAWGWFGKNGAWRHTSFTRRQFEARTWTDVTERGEDR
jgi:hypothetical protein